MSAQSTSTEKKNSVIKSAIYFAFGTLTSRVLGLARDSMITSIFNNTVADAYFAAFRVPNLFRRIFGEGALSACFIPLYIEYKKKQDQKSLAELTVGVLSLLLVVLIPLTLLMIFGMDEFIPALVGGEGFSAIPGKIELTILMSKIMFPFLLLICLFAFFMAVLNAHKEFAMSAIAPSLFNLTMIVGCAYCYYANEISGVTLAWSVIAAGVVQFAVLIPPVLRLKLGYKFSWSHIRSVPVRRTLDAFLPTVMGLGVLQFMGVINLNLASTLVEGTTKRINMADRLLELPLSLVAVSLGTVMLPSLSERVGEANFKAMNRELSQTLKVVLYLCVPAAVGMWMTSTLLTSVFFERNQFTPMDTAIVASITQVYCFTLIAASLARIMNQAFYAHKDTRSPAIAAACGLVIHYFLAPELMKIYGVNGLVVSTSVASFINTGYLFIVYRLRYGSMHFREVLWFFIKCLVASSVIVGICLGLNELIEANTFIERFTALMLAVGLSVVGYFFLSLALRLNEAQVILSKVRRKLARKI